MLFNSLTFALFFCTVYAIYLCTLRRLMFQNVLLLAASYVFYASWDWRFLGLIVVSTLTDYVCGLLLDRRVQAIGSETNSLAQPYCYSVRVRRGILLISLIVNLGILGIFKYYDFFATSAQAFLQNLNVSLQPRLLDAVLPVGISFYTFQTLSYTIDVYRNKIRAARDLSAFSLFVAFFPQLVAGPIVRADQFLPQILQRRQLSLHQIYEGAYLILWGLFKKVVIADPLGVLVDHVFSPSVTPLGGSVLVATYAFAVQIYCDFSGYTDIARGCAKMMGFELPINFRQPYLAGNPVEFWHRWHISLSTWLRDYLYIPLGGNRRGHWRTCLNLMMTMTLGGLWHGASWTFVLWGVYHGTLLVVYKGVRSRFEINIKDENRLQTLIVRIGRVVVFFQLTTLGWLIFRAESMGQVTAFLSAIASPWMWWIIKGANSLAGTGVFTLLAFSTPLAVMYVVQAYHHRPASDWFKLPVWFRGAAYAVMFWGIVVYGGMAHQPFIYFQF